MNAFVVEIALLAFGILLSWQAHRQANYAKRRAADALIAAAVNPADPSWVHGLDEALHVYQVAMWLLTAAQICSGIVIGIAATIVTGDSLVGWFAGGIVVGNALRHVRRPSPKPPRIN